MGAKSHRCNGSPTCPLCNDEGNVTGRGIFKGIKWKGVDVKPPSNKHKELYHKPVQIFSLEKENDERKIKEAFVLLENNQKPRKILQYLNKRYVFWKIKLTVVKETINKEKIISHQATLTKAIGFIQQSIRRLKNENSSKKKLRK